MQTLMRPSFRMCPHALTGLFLREALPRDELPLLSGGFLTEGNETCHVKASHSTTVHVWIFFLKKIESQGRYNLYIDG